MRTIASFMVNHNTLKKGLYVSRVDGDIVTYDLRMRLPNSEPPMTTAALHSLEHLMATAVRNSAVGDKVIYFGPMGCRTGCYLLLRDCEPQTAVDLVRACMRQVAQWNEALPGSTAAECGNFADHDLEGAKAEAAAYGRVIEHWRPEDTVYPK